MQPTTPRRSQEWLRYQFTRHVAPGSDVNKLVYRVHAVRRMAERGIREENVTSVIASGREIESYPDDKPYPSHLLLGWVQGKPLHVLAASAEREIIVITVYEPNPAQWDARFERRKP